MKIEKNTAIAAIIAGIASIALMVGVLFAATSAAAEENKGQVFGLMYHQVLRDESRHGRYVVSPDELEADLKYLSENGFTSLFASEVAQIAESGGKIPDKAVIITLDDGYETGLDYVVPLLKKYNMKAVINIVGEYTDEYSALAENEKSLSYAYLTWDEINELSDSGVVEIGNHTYYMHGNDYTRYGCSINYGEDSSSYHDALVKDIGTLQEKIEQITGTRPVTFAYPYGIISEGSMSAIEETGIKVFLTCNEKPSDISGTPVVINRYNREHGRSAQELYELYQNALDGRL